MICLSAYAILHIAQMIHGYILLLSLILLHLFLYIRYNCRCHTFIIEQFAILPDKKEILCLSLATWLFFHHIKFVVIFFCYMYIFDIKSFHIVSSLWYVTSWHVLMVFRGAWNRDHLLWNQSCFCLEVYRLQMTSYQLMAYWQFLEICLYVSI